MKLGLYGGSFDPVHCGHLLVAQAALEELKLDRLLFIPAAHSPFKTDQTPTAPAQRLRFLRMALAGHPEFEVDTIELDRGGVSYSIETVERLTQRYDGAELLWLIGADHVATLPRWRDAEKLADLVEFVVIPRPGTQPVSIPGPFRLHWLRGWPLAVSSSEIRERASTGKSIRGLVPDLVADIIEEERVYRRRG